MIDGWVVATFIVGPALSFALAGDAVPPHFGTEQKVEQLYKENGHVVAVPILDTASADAACPSGSQLVRQTTRTEADKEYLVWVLRCR